MNNERREEIAARCKRARLNLLRPTTMNEEVWAEAFGEGGFNLHDGWARVFAITKFGYLYVFKRIRLEEEWLAPLPQEIKSLMELTKWPRGNLKRSNPWRVPFFMRMVVAAPRWDKQQEQWEVIFKDNPSLSFWFKDEFIKAPDLSGWLIPRKQRRTFPWRQRDGIIKDVPIKKVFVPNLTEEDRRLLLNGNASEVIRRLHKRHAEDLKEKRICAMDIKESIDRLLEAIK